MSAEAVRKIIQCWTATTGGEWGDYQGLSDSVHIQSTCYALCDDGAILIWDQEREVWSYCLEMSKVPQGNLAGEQDDE